MTSTKSAPRITVKTEQAKAELASLAAGIDPAQAKKAARREKDRARREARKAAQLEPQIAEVQPEDDSSESSDLSGGTVEVWQAKIARAVAKAAAAQDGKPVLVITGVYVAGNGNFLLERFGDGTAWTACGILSTESGLRFGTRIEHPTVRAALRSLTVAS